MGVFSFYRVAQLPSQVQAQICTGLFTSGHIQRATSVELEYVYYVEASDISCEALEKLTWLLKETFEPGNFSEGKSFLASAAPTADAIVEVGPRLTFSSAFSTNAVAIFANCGVDVRRIERYRRYLLRDATGAVITDRGILAVFAARVHDRMTEWILTSPLTSFTPNGYPAKVRVVDLLGGGIDLLKKENDEMGLSLDDWDLQHYYKLFVDDLKRNPTDVELFDISQSNSEHSRHWFFRGRIDIDGVVQPQTLMSLVKSTLKAHPDNSVIAFSDNSSAIRGFEVPTFISDDPTSPSMYRLQSKLRHCLLTAETHNFPTGVAPFPGAETGTGGRIRDTHATGCGSHVVAGTAAYSVGNLHIPGYALPWEDSTFRYPENLAKPLDILVQASNGASDYGNKFGEPVIAGFARSFGHRGVDGERREYVKPIMFTAGVGLIDDDHITKGDPKPGMLIVKLGGPAYRIGMGGSAASSMLQGENKVELDFNAVQRGDAEMEQKVNRVIRACCELGKDNPIVSIHDQGAGGNCNVLKEIVSPAGGRINIRAIPVGDVTLSVLELWGAEYQENDALLIRPEHEALFFKICTRERAPAAVVGEVTGDSHVTVYDPTDGNTPVHMDISKFLDDIGQKTYQSSRIARSLPALDIAETSITTILDRVLRLLSVGSKRFLTNKVDRSVTGLVVQQQCVGPLHTPLADYGLIAHSYFDTVGVATSIGEQPIKGLLCPAAMARMAVCEAVTNMMGAYITKLSDAKCSANWMWAAKLPGEGAAMYDACAAMTAIMMQLGVAVDGGKDSLSMASKCPDDGLVKAPGTLVISLYAPSPDFTLGVTPDFKAPGSSTVVLVDLSGRTGATQCRLGASAFAQVYSQLGSAAEVPDCNDATVVVQAFAVVQELLRSKSILALHDRSDGGLLVAVLEMAFAANCGVAVDVAASAATIPYLFNEELGVVLEVDNANLDSVLRSFAAVGVVATPIGHTLAQDRVSVKVNNEEVLSATASSLRDTWEATSFELEMRQANPECVVQERTGLARRRVPPFNLTFTPSPARPMATTQPRLVVLREEGTNGDREMSAAFHTAGFQVWDVTMADLLAGTIVIDDRFQGLVFPGGFSYADVLDSAKGWAGVIRYHPEITAQLSKFRERHDTFSLGICNGCQLSALLGWIPIGPGKLTPEAQPRFIHNDSGRYESRFVTVKIGESPSIMFRGMAGSVMGVWVAHGEGKAHFPDSSVLEGVQKDKLIPLSYVDDDGEATTTYPFNPNGSPLGIAGLVSHDGRHMGLMPHPERSFQLWQWPYLPREWKALAASPWMRMFENAYEWCTEIAKA